MMAWGVNSSSWDDSVDMANLEQFDFGEIPNDKFVMTTWHTDVQLSEVFWYCKNNAFHPSVELKDVVLVHVSENEGESDFISAYAQA